MTARTWIMPGVPIPVTFEGELVGVVDSDVAIELVEGKVVVDGKVVEPLNLRPRPDVFARWKADPTLTW